MSAGITITVEGDLAGLGAIVSGLADLDEETLLTVVGAVGESQTRRRIEEEKTSPEGAPWAPNREGTSILLRTGSNLRDSVAFEAGPGQVQWGASWEFAHVHQFGATISPKAAGRLSFMIGGRRVFARRVTIPARPFVGLSDANRTEVEEVVTDWLGSLLQ